MSDLLQPHADAVNGLIAAGEDFWRRGWSLGTSSNYSVIVNREPLTLVMTGSGFDKGHLEPGQFVMVDGEGRSLDAAFPKPSAEGLLHVVLARSAGAGAVLHTHSVCGTVLSAEYQREGRLAIEGYEMLKGLEGITTHETSIDIEIFPNTQDIAALAKEVEARLRNSKDPLRHAFLIAGHGLYTWAADLAGARRQIEVLEFLFEVVTRRRLLQGSSGAM